MLSYLEIFLFLAANLSQCYQSSTLYQSERFLWNKSLIINLQLGRTGREFVYSEIVRNKRSFRSQLVIRETVKIAVPVLLQTSD